MHNKPGSSDELRTLEKLVTFVLHRVSFQAMAEKKDGWGELQETISCILMMNEKVSGRLCLFVADGLGA